MGELLNFHGWTSTSKSYDLHGVRILSFYLTPHSASLTHAKEVSRGETKDATNALCPTWISNMPGIPIWADVIRHEPAAKPTLFLLVLPDLFRQLPYVLVQFLHGFLQTLDLFFDSAHRTFCHLL